MKQYFVFRLCVSLGFLIAFLWGCSSKPAPTKGLAVMVDVTQGCEGKSLVTESGIKRTLEIDKSEEFKDAIAAYVTQITGVDLQPVETFSLESMGGLDNPFIREEQVAGFLGGIMKVVQDTSLGCEPTAHSSIYKPLKAMVERMNDDTSLVTRTIVLVTDGMENSTVSFIHDRNLGSSNQRLATRLEAAFGEFPSAKGFEFILVHQPKEGDGIGAKGVEFWKAFLEAHGASKVTITAKL